MKRIFKIFKNIPLFNKNKILEFNTCIKLKNWIYNICIVKKSRIWSVVKLSSNATSSVGQIVIIHAVYKISKKWESLFYWRYAKCGNGLKRKIGRGNIWPYAAYTPNTATIVINDFFVYSFSKYSVARCNLSLLLLKDFKAKYTKLTKEILSGDMVISSSNEDR